MVRAEMDQRDVGDVGQRDVGDVGQARDLSHLNPEQRAAVLHPPDVPLLVVAAAGTGKTEALTTRIAHLVGVHGVPPGEVLAVTFSNRAAREMRERAARLCALPEQALSISTFHSTCVRILRMHPSFADGFTILDSTDALAVLRDVGRELAGYDKVKPHAVYGHLNRWRNDGLAPDTVPPPPDQMGNADPTAEAVAYRVFPLYRGACRVARAVDFADLLCHAVRLCRDDPPFLLRLQALWTHLLVDEFQVCV
jgi:DNA helicase-2/ATP-dependent DNA helicase PcrA